MEQTLLVMTHRPDMQSAQLLARALVEARLAACVNIIGGVHAIYRWQGQIEEAQEVTLQIKTTQNRFSQLQKAILVAHPYELPEIISLQIDQGNAPYLHWIEQQTKPDEHA